MIFKPAAIAGAFLIEPEKLADARGFFTRTFCRREFGARGLNLRIAQCSVSFNEKNGTLRGMHYQAAPHQETRLVRCTRGAIFDVLLDLRRDSLTYGDWMAFELTAENHRMLYIPEGVAHGFLTLVDGTEISYQMSEFYEPESARGVLWSDPAFGIVWPRPPLLVSECDASFPLVTRDAR
jgi:dTDP-4-dehydrorhamnose 3,5-epimerase